MNKTAIYLLLFLMSPAVYSFSIITDISTEIQSMKDGEEIVLEYAFESCYGPYHHGMVVFQMRNDSIWYRESNYDEKGAPGVSQSGKYHVDDLLSQLKVAGTKAGKKVLGATINYHFRNASSIILTGSDQIDQAHFIDIFRPFSSIFPGIKRSVIPGLRTGGFMH